MVPGAPGIRDSGLLLLGLAAGLLLALAVLFAGVALVLRMRTNAGERRWRRLVATWDEAVLNAIVDPDQASEVHALVAPEDRLRFVRFALEYSRRVKGEEGRTLRALALPYLEPIAERATSPNVEVRIRAVQTLGSLGIPRYAPEVLSALDDPSPIVAMVAARALCRKEHAEYAPAVLRRVGRFDVWNSEFLASMLGAVGPDAAPALRDTLGDEGQAPRTRAVAAGALRLLTDLESGDVAARVLAAEGDRELTEAALHLLALVGGPEHLPVIRARCADDDVHVRAAACAALGTLGDEQEHPRLLAALSDASPWVAIQAAGGLVASGARPLLEGLADSDHPRAVLARQVLLEAGTS